MQHLPNNMRVDALDRVSFQEVLFVTGWSRWTLWRRIREGKFPLPLPPSGSGRGEAKRWRGSDVRAWAISQVSLATPTLTA